MLKVAFIAPTFFAINSNLEYGGTETDILNLCEELKAYCDVTLIAPKGSYLDGVNVIETVEPKRALDEVAAYQIYKDQLGEFDVIHSHGWLMIAYEYKKDHPGAVFCHTLHGIQTLPTLHPIPEPNLIALSQFHKKECQKKYGGEYSVIPNGVDLNRHSFVPEKERYFLHLGLISPEKGHDITFNLVEKEGIKAIIAGEDRFVPDKNYVTTVKDTCRKLGIDYLGPVSRAKKIELMQRAKALLLPFSNGQSFSLIAIEALSCGTPVIASNLGAIPEIITDGYDGFLCSGYDDFARAVGNIDEIKPSDCRVKAENQFSRKLMAARHYTLYSELNNEQFNSTPQIKVDIPLKVGNTPLKILVISSTIYALPPKGYSGLEALVYEWAIEFQKAGHKVAVAAPEGSILPQGIELIPTPLMVDESQAYPHYKERLGEFDVIFDNTWLWYTVIAQMESDKQLPVIHIWHSDPKGLSNPPPIKFPCLVGLSKEHARKIKGKWSNFEVRYNYNGIPLDFYQRNPKIERNGRYLFMGRYTPEKMPLEAIKLARKCNVPLDLYGNTQIIGDQNYLNECMASCDDKDVVFHLEVPREETIRLYQSHKALIHLVNYIEAFGLVPVEAMACGMPVIVNRQGALPELVEDGVCGFIVDSVEEAEEIIRSGKVDTIKPGDCRRQAERFSIEASAEGYLELFREVAAGGVW